MACAVHIHSAIHAMNTNPAMLADFVTFFNTHASLLIGCAVALLLLVVVISFAVSYLRREGRKSRHQQQYKQWRKVLKADGALPEFDSPVTLERGEVCYYSASGVRLCEPRAVRSGSYGGISSRGVDSFNIHSVGVGLRRATSWSRCSREIQNLRASRRDAQGQRLRVRALSWFAQAVPQAGPRKALEQPIGQMAGCHVSAVGIKKSGGGGVDGEG